jgi:hypothetical protein
VAGAPPVARLLNFREPEPLGVGDERSDYVCNHVVQRHSYFGCATYDVLAIDSTRECFVLHLLFHRRNIDIVNAFCWADAGHCDNETAQFIHSVEGLLERCITRHVRVARVRKNRTTHFLAPSMLAEPRSPDTWVTIDGALLMVWVALVIHVVQKADSLPKIGIRAAKRREMFHRISDSVAMFSQAFRLYPLVKNRESAIGKCCHP